MLMFDMEDDKQRYIAKLMLYQAGIQDCDCDTPCECLVIVSMGMTVDETVITTENGEYRLTTKKFGA